MAIIGNKGTPFVGSVSLTNGTLSASIPIKVTRGTGSTNYTLGAKERLMITSIVIGTNDSVSPLVTITDGAPTPTTLHRSYAAAVGAPVTVATYAPGLVFGYSGVNLTASASAITAGKTVEITICGSIFAN